jgi:hypothetical protein
LARRRTIGLRALVVLLPFEIPRVLPPIEGRHGLLWSSILALRGLSSGRRYLHPLLRMPRVTNLHLRHGLVQVLSRCFRDGLLDGKCRERIVVVECLGDNRIEQGAIEACPIISMRSNGGSSWHEGGSSHAEQEQLTWRPQSSSALLLAWWRPITATRWPASRILARRWLLLVRVVVGLLLRLGIVLRRLSPSLGLGRLSCVLVHVIVAVVVLLCLHPSALLVVVSVVLLIAVIVVLVILVVVARMLLLLVLCLLRTSLVVVLLLSLLRMGAVLLLLVCHGGGIGQARPMRGASELRK